MRLKEYFLVVLDSFKKWAKVQSDSSETGDAVTVNLWEEIIEQQGFYKSLLTDNGSPYVGKPFSSGVLGV